MGSNAVYNVTMLGEFTVSFKGRQIYDQSNRSKKLWNLLEYLITNRERPIPQNELTLLLWDPEESDNPTGALKVLLHRVRKSLDPLTPEGGPDLIKLKKGEYKWSPEEPTETDVDRFESLCNKADDSSLSENERLDIYMQAIAMYKGKFLARNEEGWVIPIRQFYHNIYVRAVYNTLDLLMAQQRYTEVIAISRKAISIDKLNERFYYNLIDALHKSGNQKEALKEYSDSTDLFYKTFGITPSDNLKSLYKTIRKSTKGVETDITVITESLSEKGDAAGAFYCEYEFFKDIYQLESRAVARSGDSIYLCLVTLSSTVDDDDLVKDARIKSMNKAMEDAHEAISSALRKGDVFARYSLSQFILLLPTATFENVEMIMKRISSAFGRKHMKKDIVLEYKMQPLEPH